MIFFLGHLSEWRSPTDYLPHLVNWNKSCTSFIVTLEYSTCFVQPIDPGDFSSFIVFDFSVDDVHHTESLWFARCRGHIPNNSWPQLQLLFSFSCASDWTMGEGLIQSLPIFAEYEEWSSSNLQQSQVSLTKFDYLVLSYEEPQYSILWILPEWRVEDLGTWLEMSTILTTCVTSG